MTRRIISVKLLKAVIKYVEKSEVSFDAEFGSLRTLEQLEKDGDLPEFLFELRDLIKSKEQE